MALIDCPQDRGHQFPDHLSECPYCLRRGLSSKSKVRPKKSQSTSSKPTAEQANSSSFFSSSFSYRRSVSPARPVHHLRPASAILKWCAAIIVLVVAIVASDRYFFRQGESTTMVTSEATSGTVVTSGTCLTVSPADLMYNRPSDWSIRTTSCDDSDALVQIIKTQDSSESTETCDNANECWWFLYEHTIYQVNTIPHVGQCFYGYRNTVWPDRGKYAAMANTHKLAQCEMSFPEWIDKSKMSEQLGVEHSALKPTQYRIDNTYADANSCGREQVAWRVTYSHNVVTTLCTTMSDPTTS